METTLNLLPPSKKRALRTALIAAFVQSLAVWAFVVALMIALTLVVLRMILAANVADVSRRSTAAMGEYGGLTQHIRNINDYTRRLNDVHNQFIDWSAVFESLGQTAPTGLRFEGISLAPDLTLTLEGTAKTRDDVLAMERQLKSNPQFTDVSSPLSNILQRENLRFEFRMKFVPPKGN